MKYLHLLYFFIILSFLSKAQRYVEPEKMKAFNIVINYDDYTVKTQMLKESKKFDAKAELTYAWYTSQKIMETKGGFDGKLIHGYYRSFYLSNQLRESGDYKYGLKTGEWKNWYSDGKLKEISTWKRGQKNGTYKLYNDYGLLMAKGNFKNDLLHGKFYTYDNQGKITSTKKYINGNEILKQEKQPKIKKGKKSTSKEKHTTPSTKKEKKSFKEKWNNLFKKKPKKDSAPKQPKSKTTSI